MTTPLRWGILGAAKFAREQMGPAIHAARGATLAQRALAAPSAARLAGARGRGLLLGPPAARRPPRRSAEAGVAGVGRRSGGLPAPPADEPASSAGIWAGLKARLPKAPSKEQLKELGVGIPFSYALLGSMNSAVMVAVCWPIFVMRSGGSPLLFAPLKLNPKFAVYLSAVYFSYGSVSTPFLAIAAVAVAPFFNSTLKMLQERLNCPRWFALAVVTIGLAVVLPAFLVGAICLSCLVCRCPVLV